SSWPSTARVVRPRSTRRACCITSSAVIDLSWLLIAIPFASALFLLVLNKYTDSFGHWLGVLASLASFVLGLLMFIELLGRSEADRSVTNALFTWIDAGSYTVEMAFTFDPLSAVFVLL